MLILGIEITNRGDPSAAFQWKYHYKSSAFEGDLPHNYLMTPFTVQGLQIRPEDDIRNKAKTPIPKGGLVIGRLSMYVPGNRLEAADLASDINDAIVSAKIAVPSKSILMDQYFKGALLRAGTGRAAEVDAIAKFLIESGLSKKPVHVEGYADPQYLEILIGSKL